MSPQFQHKRPMNHNSVKAITLPSSLLRALSTHLPLSFTNLIGFRISSSVDDAIGTLAYSIQFLEVSDGSTAAVTMIGRDLKWFTGSQGHEHVIGGRIHVTASACGGKSNASCAQQQNRNQRKPNPGDTTSPKRTFLALFLLRSVTFPLLLLHGCKLPLVTMVSRVGQWIVSHRGNLRPTLLSRTGEKEILQ